MTTRTSTYPLRLPVSIKSEAERLAAAEGTSLNQFVATAVAEKVAALRTASYFAERRGRTVAGRRYRAACADWFQREVAPTFLRAWIALPQKAARDDGVSANMAFRGGSGNKLFRGRCVDPRVKPGDDKFGVRIITVAPI